jgi:hypothetical protein
LAIEKNDICRGQRPGRVVFECGRMAHEWELLRLVGWHPGAKAQGWIERGLKSSIRPGACLSGYFFRTMRK